MPLFNTKTLLLLLTIIIFSVIPELAYAFPFTPPASDKSVEWFLKGLFGELTLLGGSNPLVNVIGVFNGAVLAIGGILLFYTLIAGTMQTAHDGSVLGRKWSSLWLPIRTALGVAAIIPIKGGYALIQYAVIWLAMQGVGIADKMTDVVMSDFLTEQQTYNFSANNIKPEIKSALRQMTLNAACVHAINEDINDNTISKGVFSIKSIGNMLVDMTPGGNEIQSYYVYKSCGSVTFPEKEISSNAENLSILNLEALRTIRSNMWNTHKAQFDSALQSTNQLGAFIVQAAKSNMEEEDAKRYVDAQVEATATAWAKAAEDTAKAQSEELINTKLIQQIKNDGWILLGSWYIQITLAQQTVYEALAVLPEVANPDTAIEAARAQAQGTGTFGKVLAVFRRLANKEQAHTSQNAASNLLYAVRITEVGQGDTAVSTAGSLAPKGLLSSASRSFVNFVSLIDLQGSNKNPVVLATEIGNRLTYASFSMVALFAIAGAALGITLTSGTNVVLVLLGLIAPLSVALIGTGLTLSYYVPMLPYILWLGAVFGWVVLVVEAVIASPLWAVTHLAPDADGVVGRGGQGYMLVLSLTLRPALMVLGFAAAVFVMKPMGIFLNETFMGTFFSSVSPGFSGMLRIFAGSVIYAVLLIMIMHRVFSLIHQIPDGILRWIGGGDNVIGREAEQANSGAAKAIVASSVLSQAAGSMQNAGNQIGANVRQQRMQEQGRRDAAAGAHAQEAGNAHDMASRGIEMTRGDLSMMGGAEGTNEFGAISKNAQSQNDNAALTSVAAIEKSAESVIASSKARKAGDPLAPSSSEVRAAEQILKSLDSPENRDIHSNPEAAKDWLSATAQEHRGTKIGTKAALLSQEINTNDARIGAHRIAHNEAIEEKIGRTAMDSVSKISERAETVLDNAGILDPSDERYPSREDISAAMSIRESIAVKSAISSPENAQQWLSENSSSFKGTPFAADMSFASEKINRLSEQKENIEAFVPTIDRSRRG